MSRKVARGHSTWPGNRTWGTAECDAARVHRGLATSGRPDTLERRGVWTALMSSRRTGEQNVHCCNIGRITSKTRVRLPPSPLTRRRTARPRFRGTARRRSLELGNRDGRWCGTFQGAVHGAETSTWGESGDGSVSSQLETRDPLTSGWGSIPHPSTKHV